MPTKLLSGTLTCTKCGKVYDYESRMKVNKQCDCGGALFADLDIEAKVVFKSKAGTQGDKK